MKKKALTLLLAVVMILTAAFSALPASAVEDSSDNTFTLTNYDTDTVFEISTKEDLIAFLTCGKDFGNKTVKLTKDIVLNDTSSDNWYTAENVYAFTGKTGYTFYGTFDGQGHEIEGLVIRNTPASTGHWQKSTGMFCVVWPNAVIKNYTLNGFYIESNGMSSTAAIVGHGTGSLTLSNVEVRNGVVNAINSVPRDTAFAPYSGTGVLIGIHLADGSASVVNITDCNVEKSVTVKSNTSDMGGICGGLVWQSNYPQYWLTGSRIQPLTSDGSYPDPIGSVYCNGNTTYLVTDGINHRFGGEFTFSQKDDIHEQINALFTEDNATFNRSKLYCYGETAPFVTVEGTQMRNDGAFRFVGLVKKPANLTDISSLGFSLKVGETTAAVQCWNVYESIKANNETIVAPDGYYYFTFVVTEPVENTSFDVVATVTVGEASYSTTLYTYVYTSAQS